MRDVNEILSDIQKYVELYRTLKLGLVSDQSNILRSLTTNLAQLETYRSEYYRDWLDAYFESKKTKSNAEAEKIADFKVFELQMIRKIMRGAYKVVDSIRSTISVYRNEK